MRVLACGGRDYADVEFVRVALSRYEPAESVLIHGDASGADRLAARVAEELGWLYVVPFPADWKRFGKIAGPIRNARMLVEGKPDVVVAFPGGRGTVDMVAKAEKAGVTIVDLRLGAA